MSLKEQISKDIKTALKQKQTEKLEALRLFQSVIKNAEIEQKSSNLSEEDIQKLLKKHIKQYDETARDYVAGNKPQKAEIQLTKMEYLKSYLPAQMDSQELSKIITSVIKDLKAKDISSLGIVIKETIKRVKGRADSVEIVNLIKKQLK